MIYKTISDDANLGLHLQTCKIQGKIRFMLLFAILDYQTGFYQLIRPIFKYTKQNPALYRFLQT